MKHKISLYNHPPFLSKIIKVRLVLFAHKSSLIKLGLIVYVRVARIVIDDIGLLRFVLLELLLGILDWTFKSLELRDQAKNSPLDFTYRFGWIPVQSPQTILSSLGLPGSGFPYPEGWEPCKGTRLVFQESFVSSGSFKSNFVPENWLYLILCASQI